MEKINKLSLPVVILIASVILGGFFYASQENKQKSIERQQQIEIEQRKQEQLAKELKEQAEAEQAKKEYIAKRKNECYDIYLQEKKNWNNVKDFSYSEVRDVCIVKYKSDKSAKTKEECEEMFKNTSDTSDYLRDIVLNNYFNCLENWFSKEF